MQIIGNKEQNNNNPQVITVNKRARENTNFLRGKPFNMRREKTTGLSPQLPLLRMRLQISFVNTTRGSHNNIITIANLQW